ncbi:MAG: hypothetical protein ACR2K4_08425 [Candidatus Limnocylindria bacterium]
MTTQADLLAAIADRLEKAGIPYMVVGSVAGSLHGEPRTTIDIDLVVDPSADSLRRFVDSLPASDYYVDLNAAIEAFERRTSFNVIEHSTGWKADLMIRRDRPFSRTEFDRRIQIPLYGRQTPVATAEDTVIAKLEWAKAGESERQLRDVARILAISGASLDGVYLAEWIKALDLGAQWDRAFELAEDGPDV